MKSILVTGGAGYIGSHVVVELVAAGYRPIIVDNFINSKQSVIDNLEKLINGPVTWYKYDYQDINALKKIIEKEQIEGVIHFAAFKSVDESVKQPLKYYNNNVAGLIEFLDLVEEMQIKNFVFSSSCTVYGDPDKLPVTEDSLIKPAKSPYGATKQIGETILHDTTIASKNLKAMALRYFNPIGAHPSSLIGELPLGTTLILVPIITQTAAGLRDSLTVFGNTYPTPDGSCVRDFIHVVDLAKAHVKALETLAEQKARYYDVYNIGAGKGHSILEVIKIFEKTTGVKIPYTIGPRRTGDVISTYASVNKANRLLNWKAEKSLAEGLKDAWHWQQKIK